MRGAVLLALEATRRYAILSATGDHHCDCDASAVRSGLMEQAARQELRAKTNAIYVLPATLPATTERL